MRKQKHLILAIIILFIIVPVGFYSKLYSGIGYEWINNKLGGVFYEMFWCLVVFIFLPKLKLLVIATWVFIITCILEFVQLLDNNLLEIIRSNFIGRTIIGSSFSWSDFPYYLLGSFLGFMILKGIEKQKTPLKN